MSFLVSVVLPLALAFIMFSLGVGLSAKDFARVGQRPTAFLVGALNQMILLPVVAYFVVIAFGLTKEIAVGVMILAACPGGVTSNVIARMGKADVALSVSLTAVISLLGVLTIPLILGLSMSVFMGQDAPDISIVETALKTFAITVVPIVIGLTCKHVFPDAMARAEPALSKLAIALFALIVIAALAANWSLFTTNVWLLGPALLTLLLILTLFGFVVPRLLGRTRNESKTVSIETGVQNAALGIAIAGGLTVSDGISAYALPAAVYGPLMYLIVLPVIFIYRRMD